MSRMIRQILPLLLAGTLSAQEATDEWSSYTRFTETETEAKLETAIARYKSADGIEVDLIGAVHIGDLSYYVKLNELFKEYDVILYEMVGDPERIDDLTGKTEQEAPAGAPAELTTEGDDAPPADEAAETKTLMHPIAALQVTMQKMLGLQHQVDHVDYTATNFIHADMSATKFDEEKEKRGETFLLMIIRSYKQQFKMLSEGNTGNQPDIFAMIGNMIKYDFTTGMKLTFGRALEDTEAMIGGLEGEKGSVILTERNKFALGVLRKTLDETDHKKIGIFYGAAHLPDMDKRMREEFKFDRSALDWLTAWQIPKAK
jgi:hypothetical protein